MLGIAILAALVTGVLAGVNPYLAPRLAALLDAGHAPVRIVAAVGAVAAVSFAVIAAAAYEFASFVSGRLTAMIFILGVVTLLGAFLAVRPMREPRGRDTPATAGWRAWSGYAGDMLYFAAPVWLVSLAGAMRQVSPASFAVPFVTGWLGLVVATLAWVQRAPEAIPREPPSPARARTRHESALGFMYGVAAVIVLVQGAAWL